MNSYAIGAFVDDQISYNVYTTREARYEGDELSIGRPFKRRTGSEILEILFARASGPS